MPITFDLISDRDDPADAVIVTITRGPDGPQADVTWRANASTHGGDYLYPTVVPLALTRALDVREHYGFERVVIRLDDVSLWDSSWGELKA